MAYNTPSTKHKEIGGKQMGKKLMIAVLALGLAVGLSVPAMAQENGIGGFSLYFADSDANAESSTDKFQAWDNWGEQLFGNRNYTFDLNGTEGEATEFYMEGGTQQVMVQADRSQASADTNARGLTIGDASAESGAFAGSKAWNEQYQEAGIDQGQFWLSSDIEFSINSERTTIFNTVGEVNVSGYKQFELSKDVLISGEKNSTLALEANKSYEIGAWFVAGNGEGQFELEPGCIDCVEEGSWEGDVFGAAGEIGVNKHFDLTASKHDDFTLAFQKDLLVRKEFGLHKDWDITNTTTVLNSLTVSLVGNMAMQYQTAGGYGYQDQGTCATTGSYSYGHASSGNNFNVD